MSADAAFPAVLFFAYGLYGLLAQAFLLRELAVVFLGHELSFNLALASWLLWTGMGSLSRRPPPTTTIPGDGERRVGRALAALALAGPLTLLAVRAAKLLTPFGRLPGLAEAFLVPLIALAPVCALNGSVFRAGAGTWDASKVYLAESAGALAGGVLFSLALAGRTPALAALCAGAVLLAALAWSRLRGLWLAASAAIAFLLLIVSGPLDRASRALEWRGYDLLDSYEGRYEHLAIARVASGARAAPSQRILFENGVVSAEFPDPSAVEWVHWPLLAHPRPKRVLLLGVGLAGAAAEVLKHPVKQVDAVVVDRRALALVRAQLRGAQAGAWEDPRVRTEEADPRDWVRSHPGSYDVILQLSPDPANASLNRLFTEEFFRSARQALAPGGLRAFSLAASENYLALESAYVDASVWNALRAVFPRPAVVPGERLVLIAGERPVALDAAKLLDVYAARRIAARVVVPPQFPFYLSPERTAYFLARLEEFSSAAPNSDAKPAAYFLTWKLWLSKFVSPVHFLGLCLLTAGALLGLASLWAKREQLLRPPVKLAVLSLGFSGMGFEIVLLLAFQAASGALYWKLGLLLAALMAGTAAGALLAAARRRGRFGILALLVLMACAEAAVARGLPALAAVGASRAALVFGALLAFDGLLLGLAYPWACAEDPAGVYAADLWGASLGAFLTAAFLVPLCGMRLSLELCAAALLPAAVRLLVPQR